MLKLVRMIQKLKNDTNRDDSLLFQTAQFAAVFSTTVTILIDVGPMKVHKATGQTAVRKSGTSKTTF